VKRYRLGVAFGALALAASSMAAVWPGGVATAATKTTTSKATQPAASAPAASGTIASVSGDTLEVQNPESGQTTVTISSKTTITATVSVTLKAVASGTCLTATGTKTKSGALDATTVTLTSAAGGGCSRRTGFGGGGTARVFRAPSSGSSSAKSRPTFKVAANAATAFGEVSSVSGSTIALKGTIFSLSSAFGKSSGSKAKGQTSAPKATKVSVVVSSKTKYLRTGLGSASSLKVGDCATAFGPTNDIGAVAATRLSVSPATSSGCVVGFGGFGHGGGSSGASA